MTVPLFPLNTVLFPGGPLPLRVFEARYIDMVGDCMRSDTPFGVLLLAKGPEVGSNTTARTVAVGTLAKIVDWYQGTDGLLGITALGTERFQLKVARRKGDGLNMGEVDLLPAEASVPVPEEFAGWSALLRGVLDDLGKLYEATDRHYDDATWLGFRFAEILPIEMQVRQQFLEMTDPIERLRLLRPLLRQVREGQPQ
jgi:Lon protease-like protein